jgi:hypothetical protein
MGVLKEDYVDTIEWVSEELVDEVEDPSAAIPIDKPDCEVIYTINPREVKYDPRTIAKAAKIFWAADESWTMPSEGWDQTNFGLFSGDDQLGGTAGKRVFEKVEELNANRLVISECGHGFRSTRCEAPNWSQTDVPFPMESSIFTMLRYIDEGRIVVDPAVCKERVTYHDSCNLARSCGITEEPRRLLRMVANDFVEMIPNRAENFCCTGGGGAMSMSEYTPRRLASAKVKADQIAATGATIVVTSCHNCVDGLADLIKHYKLDCKVLQLVDLVGDALVVEECAVSKKGGTMRPEAARALEGRRILVVERCGGHDHRGVRRRPGHRTGEEGAGRRHHPRHFHAGQGRRRGLPGASRQPGYCGHGDLRGHRAPGIPGGDLRRSRREAGRLHEQARESRGARRRAAPDPRIEGEEAVRSSERGDEEAYRNSPATPE